MTDLYIRSNEVRHKQPFPIRVTWNEKQSRNPFDSPSISNTSANESDGGSTSGQDEFGLERYSSDAKYKHLRQISRSTNGEKKPDLNIITDFAAPKMPMKPEAVTVNEVNAKQAHADRKLKALSIVSHKAVQSTVSSAGERRSPFFTPSGFKKRRSSAKDSRKGVQRLQHALPQRQVSPFSRIPIGITIPRGDAAALDRNATDGTPITPAITVTPAGEDGTYTLHRERRDQPPVYDADRGGADDEKTNYRPRNSYDSSEMILPESSETPRAKSQGWWNLMLSPLLRAGSVASRAGRQPNDTPPVPPLPFSASEKDESPALSAKSDPSFMVSARDTSPDTPRRQGLASGRASTWSRWTEWEQEREINSKPDEELVEQQDLKSVEPQLVPALAVRNAGLAAEYFHACAVEQLTGESYFECIGHSCAEQLPKLHSVHDFDKTKPATLASPFEENRRLNFEDIATPSVADEDETLSPDVLSPNVRQAKVAPMVRVKALSTAGSDKGSETKCDDGAGDSDKAASPRAPIMIPVQIVPTYAAAQNNGDSASIAPMSAPQLLSPSASKDASQSVPKLSSSPVPFAALPEKAPIVQSPITSPGPLSPEGQKTIAPMGSVPLTNFASDNPYANSVVVNNYSHGFPERDFTPKCDLPQRPAFITAETEYPPLPDRVATAPVTARDLESTRRISIEERRHRLEKEDDLARKIGGLWRGRGCIPKNGCFGRSGPEGRTKRRWIVGIALALLTVIVVSIVLAVTLTRNGTGTPIDSQWLNLTGYPPMPTGILTIAAPSLAAQQKQCVSPTTMWSCSVPKEDRDSIGTNDADQPNFRFEIKFRNGTVPANMTVPIGNEKVSKTSNDPFTNDLFVANPPPPNQEDRLFLGNTTDNLTAPFDGEQTPFFISFMSAFPIDPTNDTTNQLVRRQNSTGSALLTRIPAPVFADDGSAAPASLLPTTPFPISQPVRIYNRGLQDEHYGFYMYYDKSVYLSGLQIDGQNTTEIDLVEADQVGGSTKSTASARCTFAQTRFLVRMYTNPAFDGSLLSSLTNSNLTHPDDKKDEKVSSALDLDRPGSFPYPASIVLDRHGGDIDTKAIYCYGMSNGKINEDDKVIVGERRGFGGQLINPAPEIFQDNDDFDRSAGGIDGGTGGCGCTWQNWE